MIIIGQAKNQEQYERYTEAVFTQDSKTEKNYLISPGDKALCITSANSHVIVDMRYGLVPFMAKTEIRYAEAPIEGNGQAHIHGPVKKRLIHDPAFRKPIRQYRTIIPADYFILYENQQTCLFFHHDYALLSLAGIYDYPLSLSGAETVNPGFAILTWPAYGIFKSVGFSRVPLILPVNRHKKWIRDGISLFEVTQMIVPYNETLINGIALVSDKLIKGENSRNSIQPVGKRFRKEQDIKHSGTVRSNLRDYRRQLHDVKKHKSDENTTPWRSLKK